MKIILLYKDTFVKNCAPISVTTKPTSPKLVKKPLNSKSAQNSIEKYPSEMSILGIHEDSRNFSVQAWQPWGKQKGRQMDKAKKVVKKLFSPANDVPIIPAGEKRKLPDDLTRINLDGLWDGSPIKKIDSNVNFLPKENTNITSHRPYQKSSELIKSSNIPKTISLPQQKLGVVPRVKKINEPSKKFSNRKNDQFDNLWSIQPYLNHETPSYSKSDLNNIHNQQVFDSSFSINSIIPDTIGEILQHEGNLVNLSHSSK
jgi:hypothetical protein